MKEVKFIQGKLRASKKAKSVEELSELFANLVMQGKLAAAIKPFDKESSPKALSISPEMMEEFKLKHLPAIEIEQEDSVTFFIERRL